MNHHPAFCEKRIEKEDASSFCRGSKRWRQSEVAQSVLVAKKTTG
jgi:hypothetical protein